MYRGNLIWQVPWLVWLQPLTWQIKREFDITKGMLDLRFEMLDLRMPDYQITDDLIAKIT
jgi:hypothetical protein